MGLPAGQQRALDTIEHELTASDPRLVSLFSFFHRLTRAEAMPWREDLRPGAVLGRLARAGACCDRIAHRPLARLRAAFLVPAALTAMVCTLTLAFAFGGAHKSPAAGGRVAATRKVAPPTGSCRLFLVPVNCSHPS